MHLRLKDNTIMYTIKNIESRHEIDHWTTPDSNV